jgi:hypothetical protein
METPVAMHSGDPARRLRVQLWHLLPFLAFCELRGKTLLKVLKVGMLRVMEIEPVKAYPGK